jgi:hypothetical protein
VVAGAGAGPSQPGPEESDRTPANDTGASRADVPTGGNPAATKPRLQPVPAPSASAVPSRRGLTEERAWLRRTLSRDFDAMASSVSRILSEHPGMQAGDSRSRDDVLADSVAVRLYLSHRGAAIDAGLRSGTNGPHVPLARCAVSGLTRLPSHRGATIFSMSPSPQEWQLYRDRRLVTEWGFVNALTAPCARQQGEVDVLLWSMTARRTNLLEPEGDERTTDRVLFVPGTSFKLLDMAEPTPEGKRGFILMREIGANEIDNDGRVDPNRLSLDELAVASLRRCLERWADAEPRPRIGTASMGRFDTLPGIV